MVKLYYCSTCKRIFESSEQCDYCQSSKIKELKRRAPVNVIGSKIKGNIYRITKDQVKIVHIDEFKNQSIKEVKPTEIRKVL